MTNDKTKKDASRQPTEAGDSSAKPASGFAAADQKNTPGADPKSPGTGTGKAAGKKDKSGGKATGDTKSGGLGWILLLAIIAAGSWFAWQYWPQLKTYIPISGFSTSPEPERNAEPVTAARSGQPDATSVEAEPEPESEPQPEARAATRPETQTESPTRSDAGSATAADSSVSQPATQPATPPATPPATQAAAAPAFDSSALEAADAELQKNISGLREELEGVGRRQGVQDEQFGNLERKFGQMQKLLDAQTSRIQAMGNVTREDWQLAEANYLLRLASQRLQMERNAEGALGLVTSADRILKELDMHGLFATREQLARDIAALKLTENVDREGIYLALRALEQAFAQLPLQPQFELEKQAGPDSETEAVGMARLEASLEDFRGFLKDAIRIREGAVDPVLLAPESEARVRQALRMQIEQAQLALLRGESKIYLDALQQASKLLGDYAPAGKQRDVLLESLQELSQRNIEQTLPDIGGSLESLQDFIYQMQRLEPSSPRNGSNSGDSEDGA
ncbi:uroporphyrinogen-III C-methyltransferase [Biformimicrobium ophioploci]|uniref:Uncharacterized protein n=1 Tax=Biformimicrobium ophioploci TaxID=3036711 RepID=A0ABQ6LV62_9GAMM|nr:uroporphyrinogen-III C-methyltransferase [Microbulbifer sp. NKW57]GMG85917.1 hypothetical protein MNKW57_02380 [Microbulbifer sp. NKW57]